MAVTRAGIWLRALSRMAVTPWSEYCVINGAATIRYPSVPRRSHAVPRAVRRRPGAESRIRLGRIRLTGCRPFVDLDPMFCDTQVHYETSSFSFIGVDSGSGVSFVHYGPPNSPGSP